MIEAGNVSAQEEFASVGFAHTNLDIERICQERSEEAKPPEVFLLSCRSLANSLLAVNVEFLEKGQLVPYPRLPLFGEAFDPDWGFARAEIKLHGAGPAEFQVPPGHPDTFTNGSTWGYRVCPIDSREIPDTIAQLAHIRAELAKPRQRPSERAGSEITVTVI
jgi:hypothetical protein